MYGEIYNIIYNFDIYTKVTYSYISLIWQRKGTSMENNIWEKFKTAMQLGVNNISKYCVYALGDFYSFNNTEEDIEIINTELWPNTSHQILTHGNAWTTPPPLQHNFAAW